MTINGKELQQKLIVEIREKLHGKSLCFVQFGENNVSEKFIAAKTKLANSVGMLAHTIIDTESKTTQEVVRVVTELAKHSYDGIVVQLPLPSQFNTQLVLDAIAPEKDVDVLATQTKQQFMEGKIGMVPPVAAAVHYILEANNIELIGKNIVILGKGKLVGEPVAMLFDQLGIAYQATDKDTPESVQLELLKNADIVISGIGIPHYVKPEMVKNGVVLIDAGTSEQAGKLSGDIDPTCADKASLYTPVPGGVGPVTVACLFRNLFCK